MKFPSRLTCQLTLLLFLALAALPAQADSPDRFVGTLTFEVSDGKLKTPVRYYSDGKRLRVEMGSSGMPSRIWLSGMADVEGALALSPFKKTYTIEQDELILPYGLTVKGRGNSSENRKPVVLPAPDRTQIKGLDCFHFTIEAEGPATDVWVLPMAVPMPLTVFGVWPDFIEAAPAVAKATRSLNGLPLKIERRNWRGKRIFSLKLIDVAPGLPEDVEFLLPEGYSRGGAAPRLRLKQRDGLGN